MSIWFWGVFFIIFSCFTFYEPKCHLAFFAWAPSCLALETGSRVCVVFFISADKTEWWKKSLFYTRSINSYANLQWSQTSTWLSIYTRHRILLREPLLSFYKQCLYNLQVMIDFIGKFPMILQVISYLQASLSDQ